jgi:hypothetical protein
MHQSFEHHGFTNGRLQARMRQTVQGHAAITVLRVYHLLNGRLAKRWRRSS